MVDPLVVRQHKDNQVLFIHPVRFGSVRFGSVRFGSVRFGSVRFGSVRFGSVRFGSVRFGSVRFGSELIRCLSPSHPPDHEVVILLFN
jgi:hypothetical protein